jgi:hypothetical protein
MPIDLTNGKEEVLPDESQKEDIPNTLPENEKEKVNENTIDNGYHPEKVNFISNSVEKLINRNLDAKKMLADELCEMGLSVDEIMGILRF